MENQLKEKAIQFLTTDKLSVIPVGKNKIPLIAWKEYQTRFPTIKEIIDWWNLFPDAQIGICTGRLSDLTVVDVEEGGDPSFLPQNTFIVKTGGNGWHYYYKFQEGMQNKARIRPLVDIRSEGGYVVSPFSSSEKGTYEILNNVPLSPFPKELFQPVVISTVNPTVNLPIKIDEKVLASDSFFLLESYPGYGTGQRNDEMTRFIGRTLNKINAAHWSTHGWAIIQKANAKNKPPLPINELLASFNSIKGREVASIPIHASEGVVGAQETVLIPTDGSDEVKHIKVVAGEQKMDSLEIFPTEMKIFDDALRGGFRLGNVVIVAAPTGQGKTSICQDWTLSFTRASKKTGVLWFSYEVMVADLWENFLEMGMNEDDIAVIPAKHTSGNIVWVEAKIKEAKEKFDIKVVVIDHLGFLLPKTLGVLGKNMSLNQASFVTQIVRDLKTLAIQEEVVIILPVHVAKIKNKTKVDQEDIKDSSGIAQEADCVFLIEREKNNDKDIKEYFTENTKITLSKNRKYGTTPFGWFTMIKRRFAFSDKKEKEEVHKGKMKKDWNSFKEKDKVEEKTNYPGAF